MLINSQTRDDSKAWIAFNCKWQQRIKKAIGVFTIDGETPTSIDGFNWPYALQHIVFYNNKFVHVVANLARLDSKKKKIYSFHMKGSCKAVIL